MNKINNKSTAINTTKNKIITYSIIGFLLLVSIGIVLILAKPNRKNPKIK